MLCVLLKKILYCGNNICMCFVDFVADSLVSCRVMIDGGSFVIKSCKHGIAVLSEETFHVMAYVSKLVVVLLDHPLLKEPKSITQALR